MPATSQYPQAMLQQLTHLKHAITTINAQEKQKRKQSLENFLIDEAIHYAFQRKHRKLVNHHVLRDVPSSAPLFLDAREESNIWKCFKQVGPVPKVGMIIESPEADEFSMTILYTPQFEKFVDHDLPSESSSKSSSPRSNSPVSSSEESKDSGVDVVSEPEYPSNKKPETFTFKMINKPSARQVPRKVKVFTPEEIQKQKSIVEEFKRKIQESAAKN